MIYRGKVRGDVVVLPPGVRLPDGTDVTVEPIVQRSSGLPLPNIPQVVRNGIPLFPRVDGPAPDLDLVNKLRDDEP